MCRSCHDTPRLSIEDYVTLSPVYPTLTKPGYGPALAPEAAAELADGVPWLALGGIDTPARAAACATAGAQGIAVLGAVMRAPDPEQTARDLATAFGAARIGSGPSGSGPSGAGPSGAGPSGAGPSGAGRSGSGPVGSGPVGSGPLGSVETR